VKKILFIASHRKDRAPGQRFRFEQYFSFLEQNGYQCDLSFIISEADDKIMYAPGKYFEKALILLKASSIRLRDVIKVKQYDIVFICREAFLTGSIFFEKLFAKSKAKLVFDFDDAIWFLDISDANKKLSWLKNPAKTGQIISLCDMVFAGNPYLAGYADKFNSNVKIIPTTIDTSEYIRANQSGKNDSICIGWSGSITTIKHFEYALDFLKPIKQKYGDKVNIKVIGDGSYKNEELKVKGIPWRKEDEIKELSEIDIGIMPLPDDAWAKGKCGLKGLQYMALEIATIMSPVGVNSDIIKDGKNGYLASSTEEWVHKISGIIESNELRKDLGIAARTTVLDYYSVASQKSRYLQYFNELFSK
jgi:glycosyltransferase involved in cell wall biosynthesis